jgi:hypothetical protein
MFYKSICILNVFYRLYTCLISIYITIARVGMKGLDDRGEGESNDVVEGFLKQRAYYLCNFFPFLAIY